MIVRTGQRKGQNLYMQVGQHPRDLDIELGFLAHPAIARLIAVAATRGLRDYPELATDPDVLAAVRQLAELQAQGPGCPASLCVHPAYRHAVRAVDTEGAPVSSTVDEPHRCQDCPGGDSVTG